MKRSIQTAFSSHSSCFICKRSSKSNRLHRVRLDSVVEAFIDYRIFIKSHARCCKRHLDDNKLIRKEEFKKIPTKLKTHNAQTVLLLEALAIKKNTSYLGMFDQFQNIDTLTEEHCFKVTGWSRCVFLDFCSYINSINETIGRSKEQLVALYRYWLRKGLDQETLSSLFGMKKTQSQISKYLDQIRRAIYRDFVPYFLGAKSRNRDFFLKHNNIMSSLLHETESDCLTIVVDGTYNRLEKSSNNSFQYFCWSEQKMDLLSKPFAICCADGYFIDCYGPFEANLSDADIFDYILKADFELMKILLPKKTLILLDRGFRNIFKKIIDEYKFFASIPTCEQLEKEKIKKEKNKSIIEFESGNKKEKKEKQLSVKQTSESRLVTKCRFVIENKFGDLKNKQALDNIRNTEAGHIHIDYRIACAMSNFTHKPICPDGENAMEIANRIKERSKINENPLEYLLTKHLDTKMTPEIELSNIIDFPVLTEKDLTQKIFFGTYQLKLCKSYVNDLIKSRIAYIIDEKLKSKIPNLQSAKDLENTKIIACQIVSRHKRSKKKENLTDLVEKNSHLKKNSFIKSFRKTYKVFVEYLPNINEVESIKGYICNCKSGKKLAGCCVHVATLIYYLSSSKKSQNDPPAQFLNSIFIDREKMQPPNQPKLVRNKRHKKEINENNKIISNNNLLNEDKRQIKKIKSKNYSNKNIQTDKSFLLESQQGILNAEGVNKTTCLSLADFTRHVPAWGGEIFVKGKRIILTNTCTIDYYLLALWYLWKINPDLIDFSGNEFKQTIIEIINQIEVLNWNKSKELWVTKISNCNNNIAEANFSLFGSVLERFVDFFLKSQSHRIVQFCSTDCIGNGNLIIQESADLIFFEKNQNQTSLYSCFTGKCSLCQADINPKIQFKNQPKFIFIRPRNTDIFVNDLPKKIDIGNSSYRFLCTTVNKLDHFYGIFEINMNFYIVDDLDKSVTIIKEDLKPNKKRRNHFYKNCTTSYSLYYLI